MQPTTTRVDVVLPALLTAWRTAFPAASVLDGPRAAQDLRDDVLVVGVGNGDNAEAYTVEREQQEGLDARIIETITVNCELSTWSGDAAAEMAPLRTRLVSMLAAIDVLAKADQRLGGACDGFFMGPRERWWPLQSSDGPGMGVEFSVVAKSWL